MCGFCNVWLCVLVVLLMCECVNIWDLQFVSVCMCGLFNVWVCVCVGYLMCGCVYVWVI